MAVYVDNFKMRADVPNNGGTVRGVWSHMTADTREELDAMADSIGMRRSWIQYPGTWKMHYDVTLTKRKLAIAAGAIEVDIREHLTKMKAMHVARQA
jgi:hypothetical protein